MGCQTNRMTRYETPFGSLLANGAHTHTCSRKHTRPHTQPHTLIYFLSLIHTNKHLHVHATHTLTLTHSHPLLRESRDRTDSKVIPWTYIHSPWTLSFLSCTRTRTHLLVSEAAGCAAGATAWSSLKCKCVYIFIYIYIYAYIYIRINIYVYISYVRLDTPICRIRAI